MSNAACRRWGASVLVLTLGLVGSEAAAIEFPYDEAVLRLAIERWPERDGANVGALASYLCESAAYQPDALFDAMEKNPDVFDQWLETLGLCFVDFGGGCQYRVPELERLKASMMSRVAGQAAKGHREMVERLGARLREVEIRAVE